MSKHSQYPFRKIADNRITIADTNGDIIMEYPDGVDLAQAEGMVNVTKHEDGSCSIQVEGGTWLTPAFEDKLWQDGKLKDGTATFEVSMWWADNPLKKLTFTTTAVKNAA
jgi:hypothetical protein